MYYVCVWQAKLLASDNTQATPYFMHYIHDTQAVSDYVLLLHNIKFGMPLRLNVQYQSHKKTLMYQQLIIVYLIVIRSSQ